MCKGEELWDNQTSNVRDAMWGIGLAFEDLRDPFILVHTATVLAVGSWSKTSQKENKLKTLFSHIITTGMLNRFSRVRLCATPQMAAHQALPSLGSSRQEYWSGLPFPSPMQESEK